MCELFGCGGDNWFGGHGFGESNSNALSILFLNLNELTTDEMVVVGCLANYYVG